MASRELTRAEKRYPLKPIGLALAIVLLILMTGCTTARERPEPIIKVVEVKVPVDSPDCAREAARRLGGPLAYPDTGEALTAAESIFERVKLLLAARALRIARERALTDALEACAQ
jgi:hypothetical protein